MFPLLLTLMILVLATGLTLLAAKAGFAIPSFFVAIVAALLLIAPNPRAILSGFQTFLTSGPSLHSVGSPTRASQAVDRNGTTAWTSQVEKFAKWLRVNAAPVSIVILGILVAIRLPRVRKRAPEPLLNFGAFVLSVVLCYTVFFAAVLPLGRSDAFYFARHWIDPYGTWVGIGLIALSFVVARAVVRYPEYSSAASTGSSWSGISSHYSPPPEPRMGDGDPLWRMRQQQEQASYQFRQELAQQAHDAYAARMAEPPPSYGGDGD